MPAGLGVRLSEIDLVGENLSYLIMNHYARTRTYLQGADPLAFVLLASAKLVLFAMFHEGYGLHRDEYLYLAEARHLAWGFLEVPPLTPIIGALALKLGGGVAVIRLFPTLAGIVGLWATLALVRIMGGDRLAAWIAGLAVLSSPAYLGANLLFQPVSFNQMWWALLALMAAWAVARNDPRYWYGFGAVLGLAWLTKYSVAVFGLAVFGGLASTPQRRQLRSPHFWLGLGLGGLIALPNILWQVGHHFPVLNHMEQLRDSQLVNVDWIGYVSYQLVVHGVGVLVWIAGLWWLLRSRRARPYRWMGISWLLLAALFLLLQGKGYYTLGSYFMLMAGGGSALANWLAGRPRAWRVAVLLALGLGNIPLLPYAIPCLPVEKMVAYGAWMRENVHFALPLRWEDGRYYPLRQDYADMQGWEEMVKNVARLYHSLPLAEQRRCLIWGGSYGHAGALLYYQSKYDLPAPVSLNSSFALWAPDSVHAEAMILLDDQRISTSEVYESVELIDSVRNPLARDPGYLYYLSRPKVDLQNAWEAAKREAQFWKRPRIRDPGS